LFLILTFPSTVAYASFYTVAPGDSLYQISQRYQTTVKDIKAVNDLKGDLVNPGQTLTIPDRLHTVREGENMYSIGLRYNVPYQEMIYPGQSLRIPDRQAITETEGLAPSGGISYTDGDLALLARLITAEADSESYITKVAVGAVVLNRVKSPLFPNTIEEVIYQSNRGIYQFAPVKNGFINRPAKPDSIRAAKDALGGSDPTNGTLFFFESWVQNPHLRSLPVSVVLDSLTSAFAK